jgi:hypothetical protein
VDQGGGIERLSGRFVCQLSGRQLAQLIIDERQELADRLKLPRLAGRRDFRDFNP